MNSSDYYAGQYEGTIGDLSGIAAEGNASELERMMLEKANYNKGITDEMARAAEKEHQVSASYNWVDNPALQGMGFSDRERMKQYDTGGARQQGAMAGMYYTARQGDLASAIDSWKDAWQAKYNAAKEKSQGYQNMYDMSFGKEKFAEDIRQFNVGESNAMKRAASSSGGGGGGGKESTPMAAAYATATGGGSWGETAAYLASKGLDTRSGSDVDVALRIYYGQQVSPDQWARAVSQGIVTGAYPWDK